MYFKINGNNRLQGINYVADKYKHSRNEWPVEFFLQINHLIEV